MKTGLYIVQCLAATLVSTHQVPIAAPTIVKTKNVPRHCQMSSMGPNCPWLRTTMLEGLDAAEAKSKSTVFNQN